MKKYVLFLGGLILAIAAVIYARNSHFEINELPKEVRTISKVSPTPVPFAELTIPYLREKQYKGMLGERRLYQSRGSYNSYLTSYTSDSFKINGLLTIPTTDEPTDGYPAIVFIHGYIPPTQYRTTEKYDDYVHYLARNGFVVFKIDLRGHGESEGQPGGAYYSPDYVVDTLNAYAALRRSDFVDANKIGLWGHSMAGNVVMRSMSARPDIPAGVIWAGAVYTYEDMRTYGIDDNSYVRPPSSAPRQRSREMLFAQMGEPNLESEYWKLVSPVSYLSELKGAVQIHHAVNDDVVSIEYSRNIEQLAKEASADIRLVEHSSGGHNMSGQAFVSAMQGTVDFFNEKL
ncbi:alpha/beta fold hydrolase [Candidatus Woesebacteria bacterium]|nr:alpha/beta fold hydrolase [Candidatus Woesebacteria bacterium]